MHCTKIYLQSPYPRRQMYLLTNRYPISNNLSFMEKGKWKINFRSQSLSYLKIKKYIWFLIWKLHECQKQISYNKTLKHLVIFKKVN